MNSPENPDNSRQFAPAAKDLRKLDFAEAFLRLRVVEDAAKEADISVRTAFRYLSDPEVRAVISEAQAAKRAEGIAYAASKYLEVWKELFDVATGQENPAARIRAMAIFLDQTHKAGVHELQVSIDELRRHIRGESSDDMPEG